MTSNLMSKIISLQSLYHVDGTEVKTKLVLDPGNFRPSGKIYRVYDIDNDIELGRMTTYVDNFLPGYDERIPGQRGKWVAIETLSNHTYDSDNKIKGIGTVLVKQAISDSINEGYNGYVHVDAVDESHYFYYHLGFRPMPYLRKILRFGPLSEQIYDKLKNNEELSKDELFLYEQIKSNASGYTNIDDIFYVSPNQFMHDRYTNNPDKKKLYWPCGSLTMYLPS